MSSAYCFIIHISLYGILRLHNLYLEDLIEKNVYTYQVSELFGSLVIMFNLFYYQIKIYRCSNIFCDTYEIRWSSFARSTHPSLVAEEPYWFAVTGPWPTFLKLVFLCRNILILLFFFEELDLLCEHPWQVGWRVARCFRSLSQTVISSWSFVTML